MKRKIKNLFLTGLAVIVPIGISVYVLFFLIQIMDNLLLVIPEEYQPDKVLGVHIPGLGIIFTVLLILLCGLLTKSYLGKKAVSLGEYLVGRIPVIRTIHQASKHVVDSFIIGKTHSFQRVVLVEYPRRGLYSLGFITGVAGSEIADKVGRGCLSVFIPTTPNPTSGFFLLIPEEELVPVSITVEEAFVMIMSVGIVNSYKRSGGQGFTQVK